MHFRFGVLLIALGACRSQPHSERVAKLAVDAATGDSIARYNLGVEFYRGDSIKRDYSKAAALWKQAMEQGSVDATNNYAYLLYYGLGVSRDQRRAVGLWRKAAGLGQVESHFHLGYAALEGGGTGRDTTEAVAHFRVAVAAGNRSKDSLNNLIAEDARKALEELRQGSWDRARADSLTQTYEIVQRTRRS